MEVVNILGDDIYTEMLLEFSYCEMGSVGLSSEYLFAPLIVEVDYKRTVEEDGFVSADIFDTIFVPISVRIAEGRETAVSTDAGTGEYYKVFHKAVECCLVNRVTGLYALCAVS